MENYKSILKGSNFFFCWFLTIAISSKVDFIKINIIKDSVVNNRIW